MASDINSNSDSWIIWTLGTLVVAALLLIVSCAVLRSREPAASDTPQQRSGQGVTEDESLRDGLSATSSDSQTDGQETVQGTTSSTSESPDPYRDAQQPSGSADGGADIGGTVQESNSGGSDPPRFGPGVSGGTWQQLNIQEKEIWHAAEIAVKRMIVGRQLADFPPPGAPGTSVRQEGSGWIVKGYLTRRDTGQAAYFECPVVVSENGPLAVSSAIKLSTK